MNDFDCNFLKGNRNRFGPYFLGHERLQEHVEAIDVVRTPAKGDQTTVFVVKLDDQGGHDGCIEMDGEEIHAASQIILPSKDLHGIICLHTYHWALEFTTLQLHV